MHRGGSQPQCHWLAVDDPAPRLILSHTIPLSDRRAVPLRYYRVRCNRGWSIVPGAGLLLQRVRVVREFGRLLWGWVPGRVRGVHRCGLLRLPFPHPHP